MVRANQSPKELNGFDINRAGDRIIATGLHQDYKKETPLDELDVRVYAFSVKGNRIDYLGPVSIGPKLGSFDGPFAPRFSRDGRRVLVLNGLGVANKGRLDDVLSIDMTLPSPKVTEVVRQAVIPAPGEERP